MLQTKRAAAFPRTPLCDTAVVGDGPRLTARRAVDAARGSALGPAAAAAGHGRRAGLAAGPRGAGSIWARGGAARGAPCTQQHLPAGAPHPRAAHAILPAAVRGAGATPSAAPGAAGPGP